MASFNARIGNAKLKLSGVRSADNSPGVASKLERMGESIASKADSLAREHMGIGYDTPIFSYKLTKTAKRGINEVVVFANPKTHSGTRENPGAPLGDYAQSKYSVLTQAKSAGR